jgi:methylenetetrahydrofolate reductase (NADPH)
MKIFAETLQQKLYEFYVKPPKSISFEFFPPKDDVAEKSLWEAVNSLSPLNSEFVSVTYGAGGSTRERTHNTIKRLLNETKMRPAAHLTCVGASKEEVNGVADDYWNSGVRHIVALRGDMPNDAPYSPHPQGYKYGVDLVAGLRELHDFEISVAAYPEGHPQATSLESDIYYLKDKIEAGATRAITQFFFDADIYLDFVERARQVGINAPIVAGILPVNNIAQLQRFAKMCGANVPNWLTNLFENIESDADLYQQTAAYVTASLCRRLRLEGVEQFHFYTLNRAMLTKTICHLIGVRTIKTQ